MTTYLDLHWDSLNVVKDHLYRQLITPLSQVSGCLETAQQADGADAVKEQVRHAAQGVKMALNVVQTWMVLIEVKNGGTLPRRSLPPDGLPPWLVSHLGAQTTFEATHTQPVLVHPETFYTSLILACQIGASIGTLKSLVTSDSRDGQGGVWVRAVFDPPLSGPYRGVHGLLKRVGVQNGDGADTASQIQLLESLLEINGGSLKVQNHIQTGEQALAVRFPAVSAAVPGAAPVTAGTAVPPAEPQAPTRLAETPQAGVARPAGEPDAKPAEPEPVKDAQAGTESRAESTDKVAEQPAPAAEAQSTQAAAAGMENAPETLIVPPPGLRERLAASRPEAEPTSLPVGDEDAAPETLVVPPFGLRARLAALADAESRPDETPETPSPAAAPDQPAGSSTVEAAAAHDETDRGSVSPPAAAPDDQAATAPASEQPAKQD
jgi:hypothetical protein